MAKQFKFGILPDRVPEDTSLSSFSKDWEYFEVPASIHGSPLLSDVEWEENKAMYKKDGRPTPVTSHLLGPGRSHQGGSGKYYDRELIDFSIRRTVKRMAELGVKTMGSYGGHFRCQEGFNRTKAIDQALSTINLIADYLEPYGMQLALEPLSDMETLFPRYLEGVAFAKMSGRSNVKVMADLNYFIALDQKLEDILKEPEYCLNVHIAGDNAQPNVGIREDIFVHLFKVLKDAGYEGGVTAACPWVSSGGGPLDWKKETDITIKYLMDLRDKTYR